jgi:beta-N-acetylhexosaminidase
LAIGASGYPIDAYYSGLYINRELHALGININFAPTIDVYSNQGSTVIGPRSFGDDPRFVGILGAYFAAGSLDAGVIPTAKHFPGHGDTDADSHGRLPVITVDQATFAERERLPFAYLIRNRIPAIMSGHLSFPRVIDDGLPASLSRAFLTGYLRGDMQYDGLIITDDMRMYGAINAAGNLAEAYRLAIDAGNDIIISSTTALLNEPCWQSNLLLMGRDAAFRDTVKKAARRVVYAKLRYFKGELTPGNPAPIYPDMEKLAERVPDREGEAFFRSMACRSITVGKQGALLPDDGEGVRLVGPPAFIAAAKQRYPKAVTGGRPTRGVVFLVSDFDDAQDAAAYRNAGVSVAVVSVLSPIPAFALDWADTVIYAYSMSPWSFEAAIAVLAGDIFPRGTLPLGRE